MTEVERVLRRTWAARILPGLLVVSAAVLVAAWFSVPVPSGAVHAELARLRSANEVISIGLMVLAFVSAYLILTPDLNEAYDSLSARGGSRPLPFAAGRALVGLAGLAASAAVLGLIVVVLDLGGRYQPDEVVEVAVKLANAAAVLTLALAVIAASGRIIGIIATFFLLNVGTDSAYHQGAVADGFIEPTSLASAEKYFAFLSPPPLVDRLTGIAVIDQSVALQQFPVWEGHSVWGPELIQVSGPADILRYAVYLAVVSALFYLACLRRARQARARLRPTTWTAARGVDSKPEA
jgi:hypothetical protein